MAMVGQGPPYDSRTTSPFRRSHERIFACNGILFAYSHCRPATHVPTYAGPAPARPADVAGTLRLLAYLALGVALIVLDHRGGWLRQIRGKAELITQPLWWVAGLPGRIGNSVHD